MGMGLIRRVSICPQFWVCWSQSSEIWKYHYAQEVYQLRRHHYGEQRAVIIPTENSWSFIIIPRNEISQE